MSRVNPSFKKSLIDEIISSITANTAWYYGCVSQPVNLTVDFDKDYFSKFYPSWTMMFGKKLANNDIVPMIRNIPWTTNTVYVNYNNTSNSLSNSNFYVVVEPSIVGGFYHVYKCLNNANGAVSTETPDLQQATSFTKSDGYTWRYLYSISNANYLKFATLDYVPVYSNTVIQSTALENSGVENIVITSGGNNYTSWHNGTVRSVVNSTLIQIDANTSTDNDFYKNNGIYLYNNASSTGQLKIVTGYVSNLSGNWVTLDSPANTSSITAGVTNYIISPRVVIESDAETQPQAYSIVNNTNSVSEIIIIDTGSYITWANVSIVSNTFFGSGANCYAIVPPPGGHGFDPASELEVKGMGISFKFTGTESNTIPANVSYNQISIIKNPMALNANNEAGNNYTSSIINQIMQFGISPTIAFTSGDTVKGNSSNTRGIVISSNSTVVSVVGDKSFANGETLTNVNSGEQTVISINRKADVYSKDISTLYIKDLDTVLRTNTQTEKFNLIIKI